MSKKTSKKANKRMPLPASATDVDDKVFWKALRVPRPEGAQVGQLARTRAGPSRWARTGW